MGRVGATRIYVTPPATFSSTTPGSLSDATAIRFTEPGYVLSMYGAELGIATAASQAKTGLRMQINGDEDIAVSGNGGPAYPSLLGLFGSVNNWFPLMRRVTQGDLWVFTFSNDNNAAIVPQVQLACLMDADVERMKQINAAINAGR
jgi:hypothetical protein